MKDAKFTATMVNNSDKEIVQNLRAELNVGEKELMNKLIEFGLQHKEEIAAWAAELNAAAEAEKEANKLARYELYKEKMKEARAIIAAQKPKKAEKAEKAKAE
jgi:hypothetical protein